MLKLAVCVRAFLSEASGSPAGWLRREDRGATSVEYVFMVTLIAMAVIAAVGVVGQTLISLFSSARLP